MPGALIFSVERSTRPALRLSALHPRGLLKPTSSPSVAVRSALQLHSPFLSRRSFSMRAVFAAAFALSAFAASLAKQVIVTVGGSTRAPDGATTVFDPDAVTADIGDVVVFNFTQGNHTATQSTFAAPCIPLHDFNITLNGFDSSFRNAGNFSAITYLSVNVTTSDTIWFFDWNTCAEGGVGGININGTNYLTLDGFRRNAMRLNGTATASSGPSATGSRTGPSGTGAGGGASPSPGTKTSGAERAAGVGFAAVVPMVAAALML